jgi:hypothetical protein
LDFLQLQEPDLVFGGNHHCVDPKTGLGAYGPYGEGKTGITRHGQLWVGIVGPAEAIDKTLAYLEEIARPIEQEDDIDCVLHPSFPGLNSEKPFQIELVTRSQWHRAIPPHDLRLLAGRDDPAARLELLQDCFANEVYALSELESPPSVVICAMSESVENLFQSTPDENEFKHSMSEHFVGNETEAAPNAIARKFMRDLEASCMDALPTQPVWHRTLPGIRGAQDPATRAWDISVALLHKAGRIPWQLADATQGSCFVGISSYHDEADAEPFLRTSFAQAFTEWGEGFVVKGETLAWDPGREMDRNPHITEEQATTLLSRVLQIYEQRVGILPRKVVVHKVSRYADPERRGFENSVGKIKHYALTTVTRRGILCLRPGHEPILRGTAIQFGEKLGLVYTAGYVPFLRSYTGIRMPRPLEITENWGPMSFQEVATDVLRLTKLDLSTPAFCIDEPITLASRKHVGEILRLCGQRDPAVDHRYYV